MPLYHLNEDFAVDHVGYLGDEEHNSCEIDAVKMQSVHYGRKSGVHGIKGGIVPWCMTEKINSFEIFMYRWTFPLCLEGGAHAAVFLEQAF